jgi:uncharacterized protein YdcH (DUF465 family)
MEFDQKEWLRIYNKVHKVGREINKIEKTIHTTENPQSELLKDRLFILKKEMVSLLQENNVYLVTCGLVKNKSIKRIKCAML